MLVSTLISLLAFNAPVFARGHIQTPTAPKPGQVITAIGDHALVTGASALKVACQLQKNPEKACGGGIMAGFVGTVLLWGIFSQGQRS